MCKNLKRKIKKNGGNIKKNIYVYISIIGVQLGLFYCHALPPLVGRFLCCPTCTVADHFILKQSCHKYLLSCHSLKIMFCHLLLVLSLEFGATCHALNFCHHFTLLLFYSLTSSSFFFSKAN